MTVTLMVVMEEVANLQPMAVLMVRAKLAVQVSQETLRVLVAPVRSGIALWSCEIPAAKNTPLRGAALQQPAQAHESCRLCLQIRCWRP